MKPAREIVGAPLRGLCILIFLGVTGSTSTAQTTGAFTVTGSMTTARSGHTATLLPSGKVLIAGGIPLDWPDDPLLSTAELYDPATGTFAATGSMGTGRAQHTATLLADGRALIAGGPDLTAEIYDPATGTFTATGAMVAHPYQWVRSAPLLSDGRVFLAGYPTAQLYDPVSGTFTATGPYATAAPGVLEGATLLADGRVLLTGAVNICYQPQCAVPGTGWTEIYNPQTDTFSPTGNMNSWNIVYSATLLGSGRVLFTGSDDYNGIPSAAEVFDPVDGNFAAMQSPPVLPGYGAATLLPDGTVLISGGIPELYLPASATFSAAGNLTAAGRLHTATLLPDGTVLIAGGFTASAALYRPVVMVAAPLLFSLSRDGKGPGAIWHSNTGQVVSPAAPAIGGESLSMYTTGLISGGVIPPRVDIGDRLAESLYFGAAPGYPGLNQINFRMLGGIAPGSSVPLRLTYLGRWSNVVTLAVQ